MGKRFVTACVKTGLCVILLGITSIATAETAIDKALAYKRIGDVALSPEGRQIAYTVSQILSSREGKVREYTLFLQDATGKPMQIVKAEHLSQPVWSPDGAKFIYLKEQDKQQQLIMFDLKSRDSKSLLSLTDRNIAAFKWSPDGKSIAFVADDDKNQKTKARASTYVEDDYTNARIYLISVNNTTTPKPLTSDKISITNFFTPTLDGGFSWSPDGETIAYAYQARAGAEYENTSKIAFLNLDKHQVTELPYTRDHAGSQPVFSPDGKWIAFHSSLTHDQNILFYADPVNNGQICVANTQNFATHCLANTSNESPAIVSWSMNSDTVYAFDWYRAIGPQIYALSVDSAKPVKQISIPDGFIEPLTLAVNAKNEIAFGYEKPQQAPEIYQTTLHAYKPVQMTHIQTLNTASLGTEELVHWKSKDNMDIEGVLIKPANYDPHKKYPLLVNVHGGPSGAWALRYLGGCDEYGDMILPGCTQALLESGFIILEPNYRGSSGYGLAFRAANVGDFGGGDFQDVMTGADYLIEKNIADADHLAISGWSYGGYMTNWAVTQTNRFKAAMGGAGLTDFVSFVGTTDIPGYLHRYLGTTLWENDKLYLQRSPILFTKNVTTPLLLMHGKDDVRVPVTQSYQFYHVLKLQNKNVKMIVYPGQGHILTNGNAIYESQVDANNWLRQAVE